MKQPPDRPDPPIYQLDAQIGFILRRVSQRHLSIFSDLIADLTPTQFAVLAKLHERGALSQNALGRETAMDAATIKGVVDRMVKRGLLQTRRDDQDKRRMIVDLSPDGRALYLGQEPLAATISQQTLAPLEVEEQQVLLQLLGRLC